MSLTAKRPALLNLLEQLGDEDDGSVLAAARKLHRLVEIEGEGWARLLGLPSEAEAQPDIDEPEPAATAALPTEDDASEVMMLETLLRRDDISPETREELEGFRAEIANGALSEMDARYLRALYQRLGET